MNDLDYQLRSAIKEFGLEAVGDAFRKLAEERANEFELTADEAGALSTCAEGYEDWTPVDIHELQIELEFPWETKRRAAEAVEQLKG